MKTLRAHGGREQSAGWEHDQRAVMGCRARAKLGIVIVRQQPGAHEGIGRGAIAAFQLGRSGSHRACVGRFDHRVPLAAPSSPAPAG